jgi:hypothetical protein
MNWRAILALVGVGVLAVTAAGCAPEPPMDSRLWMQLDGQEGRMWGVRDSAFDGWSAQTFLDKLEVQAGALRWDGGEPPAGLDGRSPGFVVYDAATTPATYDELGTLTFHVLMDSGRAPDDDGTRLWLDPRPVSVYTCYGVQITFAGDTIWDARRVGYYDWRECPAELVDALGGGAVYFDPQRFDG